MAAVRCVWQFNMDAVTTCAGGFNRQSGYLGHVFSVEPLPRDVYSKRKDSTGASCKRVKEIFGWPVQDHTLPSLLTPAGHKQLANSIHPLGGTRPGDGLCNGYWCSSSCSGCPTHNNTLSVTMSTTATRDYRSLTSLTTSMRLRSSNPSTARRVIFVSTHVYTSSGLLAIRTVFI